MTKMASAFKQARGLGSSKSGVHHWWAQRVTAVFLIPFTIWFAAVGIVFWAAPYEVLLSKLQSVLTASGLLAFIILMLYHGALGMQVIIEDYVHSEKTRLFLIIFFQFLSFMGAIIALVSIFALMAK